MNLKKKICISIILKALVNNIIMTTITCTKCGKSWEKGDTKPCDCSNSQMMTVVFSAPPELKVGRQATINGEEVNVHIVSWRDETEGVDEMKKLLEEGCNYMGDAGMMEEWRDKVEDLLIKIGYWEEEDEV